MPDCAKASPQQIKISGSFQDIVLNPKLGMSAPLFIFQSLVAEHMANVQGYTKVNWTTLPETGVTN